MKNLLLAVLLVLGTVACKQNKPSSQASADNKPVVVELSISGMTCMGCVETVRSSIAQLDGIDTVSVSLDQANAVITFKPQTTDTLSIRQAIELNGYKVTGTKKVDADQ
jgi:copper chaperone CopZ